MTVTAPVAAPATKIPFRFHPRVFAALPRARDDDADRVTNDVVAFRELGKNSCDAGATEVEVRFGKNPSGLDSPEVEDNGSGTTREVIETVRCLVATPHRTENRTVGQGAGDARGKERRRGVFVARCCPVGSSRAETPKAGARKLRERLPSLLNQGRFDRSLPFPESSGRIPTMIADLRDPEPVDLDEVARGDGEFERVASLDSPYREMVARAQVRAAARPGLPDRDTEFRAEENLRAVAAGSSGSP